MEHPRNIIKCAFDALIVTGSWIQLTWLIRILRYIVDPATAKSLDQRVMDMAVCYLPKELRGKSVYFSVKQNKKQKL